MLLPSPLGCPHSVAFSLRNTAFIAGGILAPECKPAFTKAIPASSWSEPQQPAQTPATSQELLEPRGMGTESSREPPVPHRAPAVESAQEAHPAHTSAFQLACGQPRACRGVRLALQGTHSNTQHIRWKICLFPLKQYRACCDIVELGIISNHLA